jgi:hypothetical protein
MMHCRIDIPTISGHDHAYKNLSLKGRLKETE